MKKYQKFSFLSLLAIVCIIGEISFLHSCKKDVEPVHFYVPEAVQTVDISVINSENKLALADVNAIITYPDGSGETIAVIDGDLSINVLSREDGDLLVEFEKTGFITTTKTIAIDRSDLEDNSDWSYPTTVMMTLVNESVMVSPTLETEIGVEGSDATVIFPVGCVTVGTEITVTEVPASDELAGESNDVELIEGHVALKLFNFLPDGQTLKVPIEVSFSIPERTTGFLFATFVNGAWETVPVLKNGDGTGTALVSHFSDYILTTDNLWEFDDETMSDYISFTGACDETLEAKIAQSFNSDGTQAIEDLCLCLETSISITKEVGYITGYQRTVSGRYTIRHLRNVTKGYSIQIPSFPVVWDPVGQHTCHTGGSGS